MHRRRRQAAGGVTIRDVAARAEVSPMTVSRVINNEGYVSQALRERVAAAVRDLKFAPNLAAQRLAAVRGSTIALLYDNPSRGFMSEFLIGALDETDRARSQLVVQKHEDDAPVAGLADAMVMRGIEGVVLVPPLCDNPGAIAELRQAGLLVVAVAGAAADLGVSTVRIANEQASRQVAEHLLSLGHRRFGYIGGQPGHSTSEQRWRGFLTRLAEAGVSEAAVSLGVARFTYDTGFAAAEAMLDGPIRPTAIFAGNDEMAAAVLAAAHRRGLSVPRDLSIVGFDDTPIARTLTPQLTTVHQPVAEMAEAAVRLLTEAIHRRRSGADETSSLLHEHSLVVRESTGPAPA